MASEGVHAAESTRIESADEMRFIREQLHILVSAEGKEEILVCGANDDAVHLLGVAGSNRQATEWNPHAFHKATFAQIPNLHVRVFTATDDHAAHITRADGGDRLVVL